ncbi:DUF4011 domain-containing protein [Paracoccus sp. MC1854]|uniref:DUF4011 domain-containing protein n=1 Tax=Paracoccus sp. MC1854 TaxID=2760306 RepID=UPI00160125BB|nr:DUF4011 domain-containing protein [Paracoccus sp. MC1854]MBB1492900.1 DUF4011 domain-containing protein [Paracoccus sp. MC1854]
MDEQSRGSVDDLRNPEITSLVADRLNELRKRLLDFSRRNPLVNIQFKTNAIRVVDELPDIIRHNLSSARKMKLVPLPALEEALPDEQTDSFLDALHMAGKEDETYRAEIARLDPDSATYAELEFKAERALKDRLREMLGLPRRQTKDGLSLVEHAKAHGISPSYILPTLDDGDTDGRHADGDIQTLMLPEKLTRLAKSLAEKARGFERETGVNVLHAVFGLLEWRAPGEREAHVSPLLLLEIRIERSQSKDGPVFHVLGEGRVFVNTTLKQKLLSEQQLDLPEYEGGAAEGYFALIGELAPKGFEWHVRREVAFGIFPSSKIAMYHDLDPGRRKLAESDTVARLLATSGSGDSSYAEVYSTDHPEVARKVPHLVMDADASQFSALADVADGKHLSIEGPPGSGKSQTIVNLIAAALAEGKKVLFVAEKLTALDVVKNRLESVHLGEFILPLQAGSGMRERVFESIGERLGLVRADHDAQRNFTDQQQALESRRRILQGYLDALGSDFGSTGFTVHEVIGRAIATSEIRDRLPKDIRRIRLSHPEAMGPLQIEAAASAAEAFAERLARTARMPGLWMDARAVIQNRDHAEDLADRAGQLAYRIGAFQQDASSASCAPFIEGDIFRADLAALEAMLGLMARMGERLDASLVDDLRAPALRRAARKLCADISQHHEALTQQADVLTGPADGQLSPRLEAARAFAEQNGGEIAPAQHRQRVEELDEEIASADAAIAAAALLPAGWARGGSCSLHEIQQRARRISEERIEIRQLRRALPAGQHAGDLCRRYMARHAELSSGLGEIRRNLRHAGKHDPSVIRQAAEAIASSGFLRFLSSTFKAARDTYVSVAGGQPSDDRETMVRRLKEYARWLDERVGFERDQLFAEAYGDLHQGLESYTGQIQALAEFQALCARVAGGNDALRMELEADDLAPVEAFSLMEDMPDMSLKALGAKRDRLRAERDRETELLKGAEIHLGLFRDRETISAQQIGKILSTHRILSELADAIEASPAAARMDSRFRGPATETGILELECDLAEAIASSHDQDLALEVLETGRAVALRDELAALLLHRSSIEQEAGALASELDLPADLRGAAALSERIADLRAAAADPLSLLGRARLRRSEEALRGHGLGLLVDWAVAQGSAIVAAEFAPLTRAIIAKSMADRAFEIHADKMQGYAGEDFDRIRAEIAGKDRELIRISRDVVRNRLIAEARPPRGNNIGRKSEFTDMSLVHNEMNKRKNRIGVRDLTRRAGRALLELKPCWMMSPLAVAQYLPGDLVYDLVVIDEASQMTPENAIGALSRGRQAVVVGDTKQLPPTSFFQKMIDDSDVDEDTREDSESILDMANTAFRPVRQLRWHYRSRHSALIRFSNRWMYDDKLTIFPSAHEDDPEMGVELVQLDGVYKGRTNQIEARAVVEAVLSHMRETPHLSLGVCTMNSDQKELILEEFERERDRNLHVQEFVRDWEERNGALEEFFIKNLETIQGDERDVMFISTLYGPETPGGRPHQRFGPINSVHGHRRLNVLFTRAKRKIVTFTSLKPGDIIADETKHKGVRMLRAWLEYCGSGAVPDRAPAGGQTESPFEDFVVSRIEAMGYEAVPQVGAAGYRIDIGVRHPDWPYGYLLGVECDGAAYHSSKSSRDRDRLRQEVLEGLGWHFHRIWSTDWFNDPARETEKLREAITAAHERAKSSTPPAPRRKMAIVGKAASALPASAPAAAGGRPQAELFALPQGDLFTESPGGGGMQEAVAPTPRAEQASSSPSDDQSIRLGSRVKVEQLPDGKKLAFKLVKDAGDLEQGKLGIHTPLGEALLDARPGDEVEYQVGVQIREVRVLSVSDG